MNKPELTEEEKRLIENGILTSAVKSIRSRTGLTLKPAVILCQQYQAQIKNEPKVRIRTLQELRDLALQRRAVVCPSLINWSKPKPAAVYLNLQVRQALSMLEKGLFIYEKRQGK